MAAINTRFLKQQSYGKFDRSEFQLGISTQYLCLNVLEEK